MNPLIQAVRWKDRTAIADVSGEVDLERSPELQRELLDLLDRHRPTRLVVNLAKVAYMDSSGVASLVKLLSRTRKVGVRFVLLAPGPKVRSVLEITRLDSVFDIASTEQEALA